MPLLYLDVTITSFMCSWQGVRIIPLYILMCCDTCQGTQRCILCGRLTWKMCFIPVFTKREH